MKRDLQQSPLPGQGVALLADDNALLCDVMRRVLEKLGLFVLAAYDGEQAARFSREFSGRIDILVTDIVMPKLDGLSLCKRVLQERPAVRVLLVSAYVDTPVSGMTFLRKPFRLDVFRKRVQELLGSIQTVNCSQEPCSTPD